MQDPHDDAVAYDALPYYCIIMCINTHIYIMYICVFMSLDAIPYMMQ